MKKEVITKLTKSFEEAMRMEDGVEYWLARDIQILLDYEEWRNFTNVIEKAKIACQKSGKLLKDHFVEVNKLINMAKGAEREIPDCKLSRYGVVSENGKNCTLRLR